MLQKSEIEQLRNGTWQLDCPNMVLCKNVTNDRDVYEGSGYIRRTSEGDLLLKLYSKRDIDFARLFRPNGVKSGQLIPHDEYHELSVTDVKGRIWSSKYILPDTSVCSGQKGSAVSGRLQELKHTGVPPYPPVRPHSSLNIKFFEALKIPCNVATRSSTAIAGRIRRQNSSMDVAQFSSCGCDFELSTEKGVVSLQVNADSSELPRNMEARAVETLQFVLARPVTWAILQKHEGGVETIRIRPAPIGKAEWRIGPPISFITTDPSGRVWKLYDKYLTHILDYPEGDKYHPLSAFVYRVIQASGGSIEAQALTVAVAVEGVLRTEFPNFASPSEKELEELDKAQQIIKESALNNGLKKRIMGAIGAWKKPSATDKLSSLTQSGVIESAEYDAWKKLRHPSAHAAPPNLRDFQEFVDLCHIATVLFYKLIFHAIGYEGKYTNYGTHDWPLKDYPK